MKWAGGLLWAWSALALAQAVDYTGTLEVAHQDNMDGTSTWHHWVREDNGRRHRLNIERTEAKPKSQVRIRGAKSRGDATAPDSVNAPNVEVLAQAPLPTVSAAPKVLAAIVYTNDTVAPTTPASAQAVMNDVAAQYLEMTHGVEHWQVTVTTPVKVPITLAGCNWSGIQTSGPAALKAAGWDTTQYQYLVYLMPRSNCAWYGLAYVGQPPAFVNLFARQVITHETGHNHGNLHAGNVSCLGPGCNVSEYGDSYDSMSNNQGAGDFNAIELSPSYTGFIPASSIATQSGGSVTYSLTCIESAAGGIYAVKVPTPNPSRTYWVDCREPVGYDAATNLVPHVYVHLAAPFESNCSGCNDNSQLPPGGVLSAGQSYYDVIANQTVTITVQAVTPPPPNSILNGSFEVPALGNGSYKYYGQSAPDSTSVPNWTFAGCAISNNGSIWNAPPAPDGKQVLAMQNSCSVTQTVTANAGSYTLGMKAAQRSCCTQPYNQAITVTLDGQTVGTLNPTTGGFQTFTFPVTLANSGTHPLVLTGTATNDRTVFVDALTLQ